VKSAGKTLSAQWRIDPTALPQFAYRIQIFDQPEGKGKALVSQSAKLAHARTATLDASSLNPAEQTYYLHLQCIDILDGVSETRTATFGKNAGK
ncbi:MAG: hypothetical protein N2C14_17730, partial [Planctomycetales bacterium]